jgi:hypothetical protein
MPLEQIRQRLELFREFGVTRAAFYGHHLTEIEFAPRLPDLGGDDTEPVPGNEPEEQTALSRLANRGSPRLNREQ